MSGDRHRPWPSFVLFALAGVAIIGGSISFLLVGLVVAAAGGATLVLLFSRRRSASAWPGLLVGVGLLVGALAVLNRQGPGMVCTSSPTAQSCMQEYTPWPFAGVSIGLVVGGTVVFLRRTARSAAR